MDKDPTATLAPELQTTAVLHGDQRLAVLPDDPRLGEFREQFKGIIGMIEQRGDSSATWTSDGSMWMVSRRGAGTPG